MKLNPDNIFEAMTKAKQQLEELAIPAEKIGLLIDEETNTITPVNMDDYNN